ncbi:MAG: HAMP domain-containing histidine kinase [Solobacterium sp.]|nr:HAMP domain-containing histidine kinase [Solobacterium sp.]
MENTFKLRDKLYAKIISFFLLCVFGLGTVWCAGGMILEEFSPGFLSEDGFFKSSLVKERTDIAADYIASVLTNESSALNTYGEDSNYAYEISKYNKITRKYSFFERNFQPESIYVTNTYYYAVNPEKHIYNEYYSIPDLGVNDDFYEIRVSIVAPLRQKDQLNNLLELYKMYMPYKNWFLPGLLVSVVMFILTTVFCFCAAGHDEGIPGIHLIWLDKVWYEVIVAVVIFCLGLCAIIVAEGVFDIGIPFRLMTTTFIGVFVFAGFIVYEFLMSTARRIKANVFLESTLLYRLFVLLGKGLKYVWGIIPAVWVECAVIAVWLLSQIMMIDDMRTWDAKPVFVILDLLIAAALVVCAFYAKELIKAGEELAKGNKSYRIDDRRIHLMFDPFRKHALNLNALANGMEIAVDKEMKSERMKTELITNVSHDIKTPLTSIVNYVDLLQKEHTPEQEKEYLEVLSRQAGRLKRLTEDLVEASKASTGNITANLVPVNVRELIEQSTAEYQDKLDEGEYEVIYGIEDDSLRVMADGRLLWRVFSNLYSNIIKYAMPHSRIYIDAHRTGDQQVRISFKNISREPLNISAEELTERFVRGDRSRHTEGSGLGLNIAQSLVEIQKGKMNITVDGDLFKVDILLPEVIDS